MRILSLICMCVLLSSCTLFSGGADTVGDGTTTRVDTPAFSISVPTTWVVAKPADLPLPKHGTIALAYTAPEVTKGFLNNMIVLSENVDTIITSTKYSEINHIQTAKNYLEYTKLGDASITFPDGDTSRVYTFEGRYNETTGLQKYIQTAKMCGKTVYLMHIALTLDKTPDAYVELLKGFECK